jgi:hypothetical protein
MKRLSWWTSSISILLIVLILSARLVGSRNKVPGAAIFDPGNCPQPCWHGIQPGKTTLDEAEAILRADPLFSDIRREQPVVRFHLDWTINSNPVYYGGVHAENNVITKIWIIISPINTHDGVPLMDAILAIGSPQSIFTCIGMSARGSIVKFSEKLTLTAWFVGEAINLDNWSFVETAYYTSGEIEPEDYSMQRWRGFGTPLYFPNC